MPTFLENNRSALRVFFAAQPGRVHLGLAMGAMGSLVASGRIGQGRFPFGVAIPDAVTIQCGTTRQGHELVALQGIKPDSMTTGTLIDGNFPENNGLHLLTTSRALHGVEFIGVAQGGKGETQLN